MLYMLCFKKFLSPDCHDIPETLSHQHLGQLQIIITNWFCDAMIEMRSRFLRVRKKNKKNKRKTREKKEILWSFSNNYVNR